MPLHGETLGGERLSPMYSNIIYFLDGFISFFYHTVTTFLHLGTDTLVMYTRDVS